MVPPFGGLMQRMGWGYGFTRITLPTDFIIVTGAGDPQTVNNTTISAAVDMSLFSQAMFVIMAGNIPVGGSVNAKLQDSSTSNFASPVDIAGKAMNAFADTDDNKQVLFNLSSSQLNAGSRYARILVTGSAHANILACLAIGFNPVSGPASNNKASSVAQIV